MKRSGKRPLPPHVLEAVEAKAAARRLDERAFFWAEVRAAEAGVGGARSHGRCLPDTLEDVFPELLHPRDEDGPAGDDGGLNAMRRLAEAYDDVPVTVDDPLAATGSADPVTPLPAGPEGVAALDASLRRVASNNAATDELAKNVRERCRFMSLTPVQRHAVPLALAGRDVIASAATGSGKTAAYLIPALATMLADDEDDTAGNEDEDEALRASQTLRQDEAGEAEAEAGDASSSAGGYGRRRKGGAATPELDDLGDIFDDLLDDDDDGAEAGGFASDGDASGSLEDRLDALNPPGKSTPARPRCVVLVPTRELAHQVTLQARRLCFATGLKVATLHGGQSVKPQLEQLAQGPDVVVATPGRLLTCAKDEPYLDMSRVRTLVVDEADQMLDMGFEPQVREILIGGCGTPPPRSPVRSRPVTATSKENEPGRQSLLFSATFPPNVQALAARLVMAPGLGSGLYGNVVSDSSQSPTPAKVAVGKIGGAAASNITQRLLLSDHLRERKMESLIAVLRSRPLERRTLVFVAAKTDAKWVRAKLQLAAEADERAARAAAAANASDSDSAVAGSIPDPTLFSADELHGDCTQGARTRALDAFSTGAVRVLVATDVASRGLDLPDVGHVVNFDLPTDSRDFDAYVHRIGRTARAGKGGTSTSFYVPGFGGDGNGPIWRAMMETLTETGQAIPEWFAGLPDANGPPPGGRGYMRVGRGRGTGRRGRGGRRHFADGRR